MQCDMLAGKGKTIILEEHPVIMGMKYDESEGGVVMNGSICESWFCYRADKFPYCTIPQLVLCDFDKHTLIASNPRHISLETNTWGWTAEWLEKVPYPKYHQEDPRLFKHGDELYLQFCDGFKVYQCQLMVTDQEVHPFNIKPIRCNWTPSEDGRVKNLIPITPDEYVYSINPFRLSNDGFITYDLDFWEKKYGEPRGGTPAIPYGDDKYISFFHSSTKHKGRKLYFMGCMVFSLNNHLEQLSRSPLIAPQPENKRLPNGQMQQSPCGDTLVVFPAGVIKTDNGYLVSYGFNDTSTKVAYFTDEQIAYNLLDVI